MNKELEKLNKRLDLLEIKARERVGACHRKPETFEEVKMPASIGTDLGEWTVAITNTELGIKTPYDIFNKEVPLLFILVIGHGTPNKKKYLVSTEGYDYCRYVARFKE